MKWTHDIPRKEGFYWLAFKSPFDKGYSKPELAQVEASLDGAGYKVYKAGSWFGLSAWAQPTDYWYGPIMVSPPPLPDKEPNPAILPAIAEPVTDANATRMWEE